MWLYEDPSFALTAVNVVGVGSSQAGLELVLMACNRNDYDIDLLRARLQLRVADSGLGEAAFETPVVLAMRGETPVPIKVPSDADGRVVAAAVASAPFHITGTSVVKTPIGERVVKLEQRGMVELRDRRAVAWKPRDARPCRPGQSVLPPAPGRGTPFPLPEMPPQPPPVREPL